MNQAFATSGIIPGREYAADESNPMRIMAREILAGRTEPYSEAEALKMVESRYFSFEPLVAITEAEEVLLRSEMIMVLLYSLNRGLLRDLLTNECYTIKTSCKFDGLEICTADALRNHSRYKGCRPDSLEPLTPEKKIQLVSDPEKFISARLTIGNGSSGLCKLGYRPIREYDSFGSEAAFTKVISGLQKKLGRKDLSILDLGGGIGWALADAKRLHPELVTYNATRDEEFGCYDADFQLVCFMERLPLELKGKIDYIFSNMTTRYLAFCDLTVQGCVEALSLGGVMNVFFVSERSHNPDHADVQRRLRAAYEYLKDLESSGSIQLSIKSTFSNSLGGSYSAEKGSLYPASGVKVTKLSD